jgi:formate hydrogenlyase subunit 3/multisubunit Na+/H+ antiporter MnhD subunit
MKLGEVDTNAAAMRGTYALLGGIAVAVVGYLILRSAFGSFDPSTGQLVLGWLLTAGGAVSVNAGATVLVFSGGGRQ